MLKATFLYQHDKDVDFNISQGSKHGIEVWTAEVLYEGKEFRSEHMSENHARVWVEAVLEKMGDTTILPLIKGLRK